jgi:hypothetical protein
MTRSQRITAGQPLESVSAASTAVPSAEAHPSGGAEDRGEYRQAAGVARSKRLDCLRAPLPEGAARLLSALSLVLTM